MQRLLTIPLLALYVLASMGLHGVSHFCGEELVNTAFYEVNDDMVCVDDMGCNDEHSCCDQPENKTECCLDVNFILLFESETTAVNFTKKTHVQPQAIPVISPFLINSNDADFDKWVESDVESPCPPLPTPLYIQHHSLIFYG